MTQNLFLILLIVNSTPGDPARMILAGAIGDEIVKHDLAAKAQEVGDYLFKKLESLQSKYPKYLQNLRGKNRATFIAWDLPSGDARNKFLSDMRAAGVNIGGCAEASVRLRPTLVFEQKHADILVAAIEKVLGSY